MSDDNKPNDKQDVQQESTQENVSQGEQPGEAAPAEAAGAAGSGFDLGLVIEQAKQVVTDPATFYRAMPKSGGISEPLIFMLVMGVAAGAVHAVLSMIGLTGSGWAGLGAIFFWPIALLIGGFISAAIMFVIWKLMGSAEGYETAYRCVAYSTAILPVVAVLTIIPYLGTAVRVVWSIWLMIVASTEVHGRSKQTAQLVFGILGAIGLLFSLSGEYTQRNFQAAAEKKAEQFERQMQSLENIGINDDGEIDPEQMGRAVGEFMKGLEEAAGKAEKPETEGE